MPWWKTTTQIRDLDEAREQTLEVISEKYTGEYEGKLADYQTLGVLYYAIYNPNRVIV